MTDTPLAPLRKIVRVLPGTWITREYLECGHTNDAHGSFAKRRRCGQCLRGVSVHGRCPDDGTCHHVNFCAGGSCFRVRCCAPLTGVFPNDEWPEGAKPRPPGAGRG